MTQNGHNPTSDLPPGISTPSAAAAASPNGGVGVSATLYGAWDKEVPVMRRTEVNLRRI